MQWEVRLPPRLVVEFPGRVSADMAAHIRDQLDTAPPGQPIVLAEGARIRTITAEGEVSPPDITDVSVTVSMPWPAFVIGVCSGSLLTVVAFVVGFLAGAVR